MGELLADPEQLPRKRRGRAKEMSNRSTLQDLGVTRDESAQCQQIAELPEPVFEQHLAETKADKQELTTAAVVRLAEGVGAPPPG